MVPETAPSSVFWEHIYRYRFAAVFVHNKRVLDIACGEGYGAAALLKAGAASVVGIDISEETCHHARSKYGVDARPGNVENIPLPTRSIDVIISFETIEHVEYPEVFLDECTRVLAPGGVLIISTPNKEAYGDAGSHNAFHCSELAKDEFISLLTSRFVNCHLYTQQPLSAAWWSARSLAAASSPWLRVRGFCRLRDILRATTCPHIRGEVSEKYRESPGQVILAKDRPFSAIVNQYSIWKHSRRRRELPLYILAVAEK